MKTQRMAAARRSTAPTLENGDRLAQPEFHRRYEALAHDGKYELIAGEVTVPSPVRRPHTTFHLNLSLVFGLYQIATPGTEAGVDSTIILDDKSEPQPDLMLRFLSEVGGQSRYNDDDYLVGAPELVGEIAHSTISVDLHRKKDAYFKAGVQEYLVVCVDEACLHWFHFPSRRKLKPSRQGIWKSRVFPGLWLDGPALFRRDGTRLREAVEAGLASPDHAAFLTRLKKHR